jgi:transposase InsO family protein
LEIITDRGKSFLAEAVEEYNSKVGISHLASTPYHPETNGMVERMHSTLNHTFTTLGNARRDRWDEYLHQALLANRVRTHKFSPFYLLYGISPRLPMDPRPPPATMVDLDDEELDELRNNVTIR